MRYIIAAACLIAASPSWALYKCTTLGGAVSFQEQPCAGAQAQTAIKPLVEAPKMGADAAPAPNGSNTTAPPSKPSLQQQVKTAEAERLRAEAGYRVRDLSSHLDRHRGACDAQQKEILANRARANNNLAGAVYEQSIATEASAAATRCNTRGRELQAELEEARRQCTARGCS